MCHHGQDKTLQQVADIASVPSIDQLNIKIRKSLKGHNAKVVCLDWCSDKRHLVSSAQDGKLIVWVGDQCTMGNQVGQGRKSL